MKIKDFSLHVIILLIVLLLNAGTINGQFSYLNPLPGSKYHNPQTTLAIKNGSFIDVSSIQSNNWLEITGSKSGMHQYTARLSDDRKTIVVKPHPVFEFGELVTVTIHSALRKENGEIIKGESFSFTIRDEMTPQQLENCKKVLHEYYQQDYRSDPAQQSDTREVCETDSLPSFAVTINNNPAPGQIFYCNRNSFVPFYSNCFPTIIENEGAVKWACDFGTDGGDFKINYNGYLTYFRNSGSYWMIMDSAFQVIDSLRCGNGYEEETNYHDISMYPNGHVLLLAANVQIIDMTPYGGQPDASVVGVIIQELDANKDVVFEWGGWDHFQITDAASNINLTAMHLDYVHANALSFDDDGNLLLSCRHFNECTKINRETGDIMWRLGGENNQFIFVNDNIPEHFSHQHDVRRIQNGNITLYNNGNYLPVQKSSAKEYHLDENNKIATLVWYYEHPVVNGQLMYGPSTGSVQRLPNGNTLISWGIESSILNLPSMTEVDSNKNIVWEMNFDQQGQKSYRAHKYIWEPCNLINPSSLVAGGITSTSADLSWGGNSKITTFILGYKKCTETVWNQVPLTANNFALTALESGTCYEWRVISVCDIYNDSAFSAIKTFNTDFGIGAPLLFDWVSGLEVFPNPASGDVTIKFSMMDHRQVELSITNLLGATVREQPIEATAGKNKVTIDTGSLTAGAYLLELKAGIQTLRKQLVVD